MVGRTGSTRLSVASVGQNPPKQHQLSEKLSRLKRQLRGECISSGIIIRRHFCFSLRGPTFPFHSRYRRDEEHACGRGLHLAVLVCLAALKF